MSIPAYPDIEIREAMLAAGQAGCGMYVWSARKGGGGGELDTGGDQARGGGGVGRGRHGQYLVGTRPH